MARHKPKITMKAKVISFFEHLKSYVSYYVALTTTVGALWGGFLIYDNWRDNNKELQDSVKTMINQQSTQSKTDSLLLKNQEQITLEINQIKKNNQIYMEQFNALQKSYIKYISNDNALTKSDFLQYMEGLTVEEKKK